MNNVLLDYFKVMTHKEKVFDLFAHASRHKIDQKYQEWQYERWEKQVHEVMNILSL